VLDGGADPPRGRGNFRTLSRPYKSIGKLCCIGCCSVTAKGIIQSPIMSCSRRDHSVYEASANNILKIAGRRQCGILAEKGVMGLHSAG